MRKSTGWAALVPFVAGLVGFGTATTASAATATEIASGTGALSVLGVPFAHLTFNASQTGSVVSGTFAGNLELAPGAPFDGPITCLDLSGDTVSFTYPVSSVAGLAAGDAGAIEFTFVKGSTDQVGFLPEPAVLDRTCAPLTVTPYTYTGSLSVTG